jgi:hypothetical protein
MYVLRLIDFEQIVGLSWVYVLTFHIVRLFLIFLAFLYICNKLFGPAGRVREKMARVPSPLPFLHVFIYFV